ncbi:hypothetical protein ACQ4PT_024462 [Festuca glaucescens]
MAPRIAVRAVAVALVVAVAACCQLLCADGGGGIDGVVTLLESCDGKATLGQCWVGAELARKPTTKYISYAALRADQIPCNKGGQSYYQDCASQGKAVNPYTRGCSAITRCARNMN